MGETGADPERSIEEQRERYRELLEELRTIIPGVQVLLAFLLTVPFSARFADLDELGKHLFLVTLIATAGAVIAFLVPGAYHRLTPHGQRERRINVGVRATLLGLFLFAVAVVTASFTVVRFIFGMPLAAGTAGLVTAAIVTGWLAVPLALGRRPGGR